MTASSRSVNGSPLSDLRDCAASPTWRPTWALNKKNCSRWRGSSNWLPSLVSFSRATLNSTKSATSYILMVNVSSKTWIATIKALSATASSETGLLTIAASTLTMRTCPLLRRPSMAPLTIASPGKVSLRMCRCLRKRRSRPIAHLLKKLRGRRKQRKEKARQKIRKKNEQD